MREITVGANGMADGVIYYDADGRRAAPEGAEVVVRRVQRHRHAAPAAQLALAPFPDGLANRSGLVGKNLMFHPYAMVTGVFDEPLEGYKGPTGCCIMSQEFYETDRSRGFVRGYSFEILRGFGPGVDGALGHDAGPRAVGRRPPRGLRRALRPHRRHGRDLRGPARAATTA